MIRPYRGDWIAKLRQQRSSESSNTWVNPDTVHKSYKDRNMHTKLANFYMDTKSVVGLEQLLGNVTHKTGRSPHDALELVPVGIPLTDLEPTQDVLRLVFHQLKETLAAIHAKQWVHLDIRASNVVLFEPGTDHSRFYLIDCEYAAKIGDTVPNKRYTGKYAGQKAAANHDFEQLNGMLTMLGYADLAADMAALALESKK